MVNEVACISQKTHEWRVAEWKLLLLFMAGNLCRRKIFLKCRLARITFSLVWFGLVLDCGQDGIVSIWNYFALLFNVRFDFMFSDANAMNMVPAGLRPGHDSWHKKGRTLAVMVTDEDKFFNSLIHCTAANEDWLVVVADQVHGIVCCYLRQQLFINVTMG